MLPVKYCFENKHWWYTAFKIFSLFVYTGLFTTWMELQIILMNFLKLIIILNNKLNENNNNSDASRLFDWYDKLKTDK